MPTLLFNTGSKRGTWRKVKKHFQWIFHGQSKKGNFNLKFSWEWNWIRSILYAIIEAESGHLVRWVGVTSNRIVPTDCRQCCPKWSLCRLEKQESVGANTLKGKVRIWTNSLKKLYIAPRYCGKNCRKKVVRCAIMHCKLYGNSLGLYS